MSMYINRWKLDEPRGFYLCVIKESCVHYISACNCGKIVDRDPVTLPLVWNNIYANCKL